MALADDLLHQATVLVNQERKKPKQASLRRAISTAYYAVFHLLVSESANLLFSSAADRSTTREVAARNFEHRHMKTVCNALLRQDVLRTSYFSNNTVPQDILTIAEIFVELQTRRHEADYDTSLLFTKAQAVSAQAIASKAFASWVNAKRTARNDAVVFATLLMFKLRD